MSQQRAEIYNVSASNITHDSVRSVAAAPSRGTCWMKPETDSVTA